MPGSNPGLVNGQVPSASDWNGYFAAKADYSPLYVFAPASVPVTGHLVVWTSPVTIGDGGAAPVASITAGTGISVTGGPSYVIALNASAANLTNGTTGSGAVVLATSPTLVSPVLGTPTSITLTNGTGLPLSSGVVGILTVGNGGTGSASASGTALDNITGFSSTGFMSRTGAGAYSFTASTGSGSVVLATSPTLVTPVLGIATATSLALGGATVGSNAIAVTGTSLLNGAVTVGPATSSGATLTPSAGLLTITDGTGANNIVQVGTLRLGSDTILVRDAANTMALRNGVNAQALNVYNTFTDASNYERLGLYWSGNVARLATQNLGTGASRDLSFATNNSDRWTITGAAGHLLAATDNTYDIGASGANRPRSGFFAFNLVAGNNIATGQTGSFNWPSRSAITSGADGQVTLNNNAFTNSVTMTVGASNLLTLNGALAATGIAASGDIATTAGNFSLSSAQKLQWNGGDTVISRPAAATVQHGAADAAAPVAQTIQAQSVATGTTDTAGVNFTFNGSRGTGAGAGGAIIFRVAPAGTTGTAQNAYQTAVTINQDRTVSFASAITAAIDIATTGGNISMATSGRLQWNGGANGLLTSPSAGVIQHGSQDAAAPVAQTIQAQSVAPGTSNTAGVNFTIAGSKGTGTGTGGSLIFQIAPAGSTGSAQNALATALTIDNTKTATFVGSVIAPVVKTSGGTLASLGTASGAGAGARGWVTDATQTFTSANFGTTVTSGGSNGVPVVSDGTNWKIG